MVRDERGEVLFESGGFKEDGSIVGNDNDIDATRYEPHHEVISQPDQVQIYEPILADPDGAVTTVLLSAASYAKDNRLLPVGFDKTTADEFVAVHGAAAEDDDFKAGGDVVRYEIELGDVSGPLTIEAALWYQPIGYRWAHNLADQTAGEIDRFIGYFEEFADSSAVVVAWARAITE
jgi:hypothetical protein